MAEFEVMAQLRTQHGTGAMRRMRRKGTVPAIVYGARQEPRTIEITEHHLRKQLENEAVYSNILNLNIDGAVEQVVIKDLQRHPATLRFMHLDFLRVDETQAITMHVPLHFENESSAPGVVHGGNISHVMTEVEISCLPKDLPESISVDMSAMEIGSSIMLSQIDIPEGVQVIGLGQTNDRPVATLHAPRVSDPSEGNEVGDDKVSDTDDG